MMRLKPIGADHIGQRAKDEVRASLIIFTALCATIRLVPILLRKLTA